MTRVSRGGRPRVAGLTVNQSECRESPGRFPARLRGEGVLSDQEALRLAGNPWLEFWK
jgi:hypothetical protein